MFDNRTYRSRSRKEGLVPFTVTVKETNLHIQARQDLSDKAVKAVLECRNLLESYIFRCPGFAAAMNPVQPVFPTPKIAAEMIQAAARAKVGPMAAVAGAVSEFTGRALLNHSTEVIVENGGDIFMKLDKEAVFAIFAGNSPLSMKTGVRIARRDTPYALCTSSGTLGHSASFGRADAATVVADSCALADAAATALGNMVQNRSDIETAIETGRKIEGIQGIIIIKGKEIGLWGDLELVKL
ncbi:MAG: UPF0280 family protein [Desulfobacteraceae bacterium]